MSDLERHVRLEIEYDGTPFHGWARQPGGVATVEGQIVEALSTLDLELSRITCAGRTDAGVHATGQVASVAYRGSVPEDRVGRALNQHLPAAIRVTSSAQCSPSFDARRMCIWRQYTYRVLTRSTSSPLRQHQIHHHPRPLDRDILDSVAGMVLGRHDFTAFTPSDTLHRHFHRTVLESEWTSSGDELVYRIRADAFLRSMVRVLVGSMLAAARGEFTAAHFQGLLTGAPRSMSAATAPASGLCLVAVGYEEPAPGSDRVIV